MQRTGTTFKILFAIMILAIIVMIYILAGGRTPPVGKTSGLSAPDTTIERAADTDDTDAPARANGEFTDGLGQPDEVTNHTPDEFGAGIVSIETFNRDINNDGRPDRITRTRVENGTAHFYYEYKIELGTDGGMRDITPDGFRTTEGARCALQKLRFSFRPDFTVTKVSRNWRDSWDTPTPSTKTVFSMQGENLEISETQKLKSVCDVADLL